MRKPIWFRLRLNRLGWTPCAWQGWVVIGVFVIALASALLLWGGSSPVRAVTAGFVLVALLVGTAALTSEGRQKGI